MSKKVTVALETLNEAFTGLVAAVVAEAGKSADLAEALPTKKKDEDEDADPAAKAKALKALAKLDLSEMARPDMKPYAEALGIDTQGLKSDQLRAAIEAEMKKAGKKDDDDEAPKKKKVVIDDDEDEAPKKKKKATDEDEDEAPKKKKKDEDDDEDLPDLKTMRKELKIYCAAPDHKKAIEKRDPKFFSGKDSPDDDAPRLHQILADDDLVKEMWKDNVAEFHEGSGKAWKKIVAAAEAAEDDD